MKDFIAVLVTSIVAILVVVALIFITNGANLAAWSIFGPRVVEVQRDITESSKSFIDSTNTAASNAIAEYYKLNTMRAAALDSGKTAMAESYTQQMTALALSICQTVAPLAVSDYSITVANFVSTIGNCSAGQ